MVNAGGPGPRNKVPIRKGYQHAKRRKEKCGDRAVSNTHYRMSDQAILGLCYLVIYWLWYLSEAISPVKYRFQRYLAG
jgi:hypothetical protein